MTATIWLASYPKSGNTWLRVLVANLSARDGKPADINNLPARSAIASARAPFDYLLLIDSDLLTPDETDNFRPRFYEELARGALDNECDAPEAPLPVRFVKVHDAYTLTPNGEPLLAGRGGADGAIVIVRDPRDVAPSFASHINRSIDEAIEVLNNRAAAFSVEPGRQHKQFRQRLCGWSGHIATWLDQTDIPVHLVRYEDMQTDPVGTLTDTLKFAGLGASREEIERAVKLSDFARLKQQENEKGFREAPVAGPGRAFFRRGETGAWRDELTVEQVRRIEAAHAPMMQRLGYECCEVAVSV